MGKSKLTDRDKLFLERVKREYRNSPWRNVHKEKTLTELFIEFEKEYGLRKNSMRNRWNRLIMPCFNEDVKIKEKSESELPSKDYTKSDVFVHELAGTGDTEKQTSDKEANELKKEIAELRKEVFLVSERQLEDSKMIKKTYDQGYFLRENFMKLSQNEMESLEYVVDRGQVKVIDGASISYNEDKINEILEENESLECKNRQMEDKNNILVGKNEVYCKRIKKLEKENERKDIEKRELLEELDRYKGAGLLKRIKGF